MLVSANGWGAINVNLRGLDLSHFVLTNCFLKDSDLSDACFNLETGFLPTSERGTQHAPRNPVSDSNAVSSSMLKGQQKPGRYDLQLQTAVNGDRIPAPSVPAPLKGISKSPLSTKGDLGRSPFGKTTISDRPTP
jgi:hypothetical protein